LTDAEIIDLYWNKDQSAIEQSANQYGKYCYSVAYSILDSKEDAEECLNDTWLRAWNAIPPHRPDRLSLFFGKITRNLAYDRYKAGRAQKRGGSEFTLALQELDECIPSADSVDQLVEDRELEQHINRFLHSLPERECSIFLLRYWYNKSLSDIGKSLFLKENNVKASLFRSRNKLRVFLEKEGINV